MDLHAHAHLRAATAALAVAVAITVFGCHRSASSQSAKPYLPDKPKQLARLEVGGASLVTSAGFGVLVLTSDKPDAAALRERAKQCLAGQGCGDAMSDDAVGALYSDIEAKPWRYGRLGQRLIAVRDDGPRALIFFKLDGAVDVADALGAPVVDPSDIPLCPSCVVCDPGGGTQPQCPPPPLPPRFESLQVVLDFG
jgi:hypothetical protein